MKKMYAAAALLLLAAAAVFADPGDDVLGIFNDFLGRLVVKHEALGEMAMPGTEVRGPPEMEEFVTQAVVILTFENPGDRETFAAALEAENIPYGFFPDDDRRLLIFSVDMMIFVMQDAIGL